MRLATDKYGTARWADDKDLRVEGISALDIPSLLDCPSLSEMAGLYKSGRIRGAFLLSRLASPNALLTGIRSNYASTTETLTGGLANWFNGTKKGNGEEASGSLIGWAGDGHITTIAPTRSGKGVGLVIPNLLNYPGSVIVVDPKGENYAITNRFRKKVLGQEVVCIDPFGVCEPATEYINPLEGLVDLKQVDRYSFGNPALLDEISDIVDAMIVKSKDEKDPHWNDKARSLLKCLTLGVVCGLSSGGVHLGSVRTLLLQPLDVLRVMIEDWSFKAHIADGILSRAALEVLAMGEQEFASVASTASRHTEFLDSKQAQKALGGDTPKHMGFNIREFKQMGKVSIYLIVPPHNLAKYSRLIRLWITAATHAMTRSPAPPADGCPVLFMLDEIAQLGRMEPLIQAVSLLAGYGMSMWMIWQDLAQIKSLYEHEWSSFLANSKVQQYFGVNDYETAKYISDMVGEATIGIDSRSSTKSKETFKLTGTDSATSSYSEIARSLLKPDEVRRLNREVMLTFVQGCPPLLSRRITYFNDREFAGRFDENPYRITKKGGADNVAR